ncbi:hypothetical protein ID852_05265 [Xenorhabdus sp. 42]|uniref:GAD-related domain-containing protein n=1 Tax=Xenorhabdus szentirmaii TaxID=290112 RepID=A0AAW3YV85_9GAMM|nr:MULTISPECIES: GAD-like domain-containing protein [Xenorhabdus]MBD2781723.1 hypothetical protein [Xenorhabdus sp. 38]MBD2801900.1 hypothetical protein [Xenorhabdus sp. M]MBD2805170.1 hypothetical protein [Xenorhabdus sp. ZM]MBD2820110.1 hypothetical protein [Xenorhabdus sp. 42]MBD2826089.1 hypothetical protein [Xenorhabdus sp. 5]
MLDLYFESFIKKMGEATQYKIASEEIIKKWLGILPDRLLLYWEVEGFARDYAVNYEASTVYSRS